MKTTENHYRHLGMMAALSFAAMYILMYAMVNRFDDVYNNVNQVYMAGLMAAPMVVSVVAHRRAVNRAHPKQLGTVIKS